MIVQIHSLGITEGMLRALLEALVVYNAAAYSQNPYREIDRMGVVYVPDTPGGIITLAAVDQLAQYPGHRGMIDYVSCSSASAAWAGYQRSRGRPASVHVTRVSAPGQPMQWHATGSLVLSDRLISWDPAAVLSRRRAG